MLRKFPVLQPPPSEQEAISQYLERKCGALAATIAKTSVTVDLLREHRSALITSAVTGKIDVRDLESEKEAAE